MAAVTRFLESRLRLRVNQQKSAVAPVGERKFLGYRLDAGGTLGIAPKSLQRTKARLRRITKRNRAVSLAQMIGEANAYLTGSVSISVMPRPTANCAALMAGCAACGSSNVSGRRRSGVSCATAGSRRCNPGSWPRPAEGGGAWPIRPRRRSPWASPGSTRRI